jgi:hypothetical protein
MASKNQILTAAHWNKMHGTPLTLNWNTSDHRTTCQHTKQSVTGPGQKTAPCTLPSHPAPPFPHQHYATHLIQPLPSPLCLRLQNNDAKPVAIWWHLDAECDCKVSCHFLTFWHLNFSTLYVKC